MLPVLDVSVSVEPTTAAENVVTPLDAIVIASVSEVCPIVVPLIAILSTVSAVNVPNDVTSVCAGSTFAVVTASSAIFAVVTESDASPFAPTVLNASYLSF